MNVKENLKIKNIAHKMNSPLTALAGYIYLMRTAKKDDIEKSESLLNDAEESIQALRAMIKELNDELQS